MPKIAVLDDYLDVAIRMADWKNLPPNCRIDVFNRAFADEDEATRTLADHAVVVAMRERTPFPKSLIDRLPNLKLLVTTGMRNLAIDMAAARARGIDVCGTGILPYPAAEHCWALIMALAKRIPEADRAMHQGRWQEGLCTGLKGKTLGLFGLGKLGAQVAAVGLAFGMKIVAWSQNLTADRCKEVGAALVDKDVLFRDSDFIAVHVVLGDRTRGAVGARELGLMKPTAFLVNTSRGPIIDETALIAALRSRKIAGAGIDVYDVEPLPADHPLRGLDNAVLTGHTGYVTEENLRLMYEEALGDVRAWLAGAPIRVLNGA